MKIHIKGVHYDITEVTRDFLDSKLQKLDYAQDLVMDLHITLINLQSEHHWKAEAHAHFKWGPVLHIEEVDDNLHEAIEKLFDRLDVKISKEKDKVQDHHSHQKHAKDKI